VAAPSGMPPGMAKASRGDVIMGTLQILMCRDESDLPGWPRQAEADELQPDESVPRQPEQSPWVEHFWNPLAQAYQSEEEVWRFLGNWDLGGRGAPPVTLGRGTA